MSKNNKRVVPYSHVDDAEKLLEELKETLSNLRKFSADLDKVNKLLKQDRQKAFTINE